MTMNIMYKIKRLLVKYKQKSNKKNRIKALKALSKEQLTVLTKVNNFAIKNNREIKFDPASDEILIVLPKMLITLKNHTVFVHNTNGFYPCEFPNEAYKLMTDVIYKEAHRERRKLKHEVKERINDFLSRINDADNPPIYSEFDSEEMSFID